MKRLSILAGLLVALFLVHEIIPSTGIVFSFKRFPFKRKPKFERPYRRQEDVCERSDECVNSAGIEKVRCTRMCISSFCYDEIYRFDELEEGEIDIRLSSFKGCFTQERKKARILKDTNL
ncbi:uncharacterized protein LOC134186113 [Corticium candelabrum]|uniref:uncharacterized protein LOC134186113 n=1 Tax=Corticium candelabrum TaxID=121492 RepID=UPI002E273F59|nr:uncharacterized protein LOC134186113 [Corticium candelabrum]